MCLRSHTHAGAVGVIGVVMASGVGVGGLLSNAGVVKPLQGRFRWFNHSSEKLRVNLYEH